MNLVTMMAGMKYVHAILKQAAIEIYRASTPSLSTRATPCPKHWATSHSVNLQIGTIS